MTSSPTALPGLIALGALLLPACGDPTGHSSTLASLQVARSRWEGLGPSAYEMTLFRSCECLQEMSGPVTIAVRDGLVESRSYVPNGAPVEAPYASIFRTVDGLFDLIMNAAEAGAARVDVTYHPILGYPMHLFIDHHAESVDDEESFTLSNFRVR